MGRHNKSFDTYTPEELREISRKGGIASGNVRRKRREAIEREKIESTAMKEMRAKTERENLANIKLLRQIILLYKESFWTRGIR